MPKAHPVLGRLSNERVLTSSSARVTLDRVAARSDEVVKLRELNDDRVVIVAVEGRLLEELLREDGLEVPSGLFL